MGKCLNEFHGHVNTFAGAPRRGLGEGWSNVGKTW